MEILLNTIMLESRRWNSPKSVTVPLIKLLADIKKAGFNKLEIWGYHIWNMSEEGISSLSEDLKAKSMTAASIGSYLTGQGGARKDGILNIARKYFSICERLGSRKLRIFLGDKDFEKSNQDYLQFIDSVFEEILKMGQDKGIKVMAEMHEGTVIGNIKGLKRAMGKWKEYPSFGLVYQPYEFETGPALKALNAASGSILSVHLQNRHNACFTALAEGEVDYRRILKKLASSGYSGPFVLEFTTGVTSSPEDFDYRKVLSSAAKDKKWLESTWRKVDGQNQICV